MDKETTNARALHPQTDGATGAVIAIAVHTTLEALVELEVDRDLGPLLDTDRDADQPRVLQTANQYQRISSSRVTYANSNNLHSTDIRASAPIHAETLDTVITLDHKQVLARAKSLLLQSCRDKRHLAVIWDMSHTQTVHQHCVLLCKNATLKDSVHTHTLPPLTGGW